MEYIVGQIEKENIKLYNKENKEDIKTYSIKEFPEDVCLGDVYQIDGENKKLIKRSEYLKEEFNSLQKVIYIDKYGLISQYLFNKDLINGVSYNDIDKDVEYGDIISFYNIYRLNKNLQYSIVQKHKKEERNRKLEELYVIKNIDDKNICLLKNGEKKVVKLPKVQGNYSKLDLVYLDEENGQIKIVKDQIFTPYFTSFLSKHDKDTILNKNHFKITKWIVEYNYKHAISLIEFETLKNPIYVADYQLFPSARFCDVYFKIELGNCDGYEFDYINTELRNEYCFILGDINICQKELSNEKMYEYYKNKVKEFEKRLKIFKKLNDQCEKYYQEHPLEYKKYEISDYYLVESKESNNLWELKSLTHSEEDYYEPLYVNEKDLPEHLREGDKLVEVLVGTSKKPQYYYCREKMVKRFIMEFERLKKLQEKYKELCK